MRISACALLAATLLVGCGGGADTDTATTEQTTAPAPTDTAPERPEPREVPDGAVAVIGEE